MSPTVTGEAGELLAIPGQGPQPLPKWYIGLDLGQRRDHSALAVVGLSWTHLGRCPVTFAQRFRPGLSILALERFPLGTSYDDLHNIIVGTLTHQHPGVPDRELIVDAGGPGPPVVDRLRQTLRTSGVSIRPVIITGGKGMNTISGGYTGIPRSSLISNLLLCIGAGVLICEKELANWERFEEELTDLRGDTTHPSGATSHDDLVMAVALSVSAAVRDTPKLLPAPDNRPTRLYGFIDRPLY